MTKTHNLQMVCMNVPCLDSHEFRYHWGLKGGPIIFLISVLPRKKFMAFNCEADKRARMDWYSGDDRKGDLSAWCPKYIKHFVRMRRDTYRKDFSMYREEEGWANRRLAISSSGNPKEGIFSPSARHSRDGYARLSPVDLQLLAASASYRCLHIIILATLQTRRHLSHGGMSQSDKLRQANLFKVPSWR